MLSDSVILDALPDTWEFANRSYQQATPGAIFKDRVVGRGLGPIPIRTKYTQFIKRENLRGWLAIETWCTEGDRYPVETPSRYRLSSGRKIWRKHPQGTTVRMPLP